MTNLKRFEGLINEAVEQGGLTVGLGKNDFLKVKNLKSGFMVGGYSDEYKISVHDLKHMDLVGLYFTMIDLHKQAATAAGLNQWDYTVGLYLGFWIDNGYLYMEISKKITSKKEALIEAEKRQQLAIYDCKNNESIYL